MKEIGYFKYPIISISLHIPGHTIPLYDQGFILKVDKILEMYSSDCSSYFINNIKKSSKYNLRVNSIDDLIKNTPIRKHNECFVNINNIEILSGYVYNKSPTKEFVKFCKDRDLIIKYII